jgi:hypothetical protein
MVSPKQARTNKNYKHETIMKIQGMKKEKYNLLRARVGKRQISETEYDEDIHISQEDGSQDRSSMMSSFMHQALKKKHGATLNLPTVNKKDETESIGSVRHAATFNDKRQSMRLDRTRDK